MHAVLLARSSLRRRLAAPPTLCHAHAPASLVAPRALRPEPSLASRSALWSLQETRFSTAATGPSPPKLVAAKALAARLRRKAKSKVVVKVVKTDGEVPVTAVAAPAKPKHAPKHNGKKKRKEEEALLAAASTRDEQEAAGQVAVEQAQKALEDASETSNATAKDVKEEAVAVEKPTVEKVEKVEKTEKTEKEKKPAKPPQEKAAAPAPAPVPTKKAKKEAAAMEKITMTLKEIETLQKQLPSVEEVAVIVDKIRRESFVEGQMLFDLYRIYGNPFLDENFLTPGVLACCEAKKPAEGIQIVRDMLDQGRKVEESTLRALVDVCDETSAAKELIELWELMDKAGVKLTLKDLNRMLEICHRKEYLDGAIKVLKELRLHRPISVHSYMHWLNQATLVWRADAFFDLLMEMRLSGVEPEISSLTSLESGRKDRALTVMEGVRAVGLDACFAMSSVFSSMQFSVYKNGPAAAAITASDINEAKQKFGDLRAVHIDWPTKPIPQVLETQAAGLILQQETFRRLKISQVHRIDELLQMLPITTNMTINLRKQLQRMSLLVNTHRVKRDAKKIMDEYDTGKSLIELSSIHNYPPVSLMRIILRQRGLSSHGIKRALNAPTTHLSKRDQYELRKAAGYDSIHRSDPFIGEALYNADSLETTIGHFLRSHGIRFKTEDELGDEQHAKYGRRVISPDLLLLDPVIVNGTPIRWIDAKNYYGAHIVSKRLISRQLESYVKEWGPGAIVFGMGFSDMFSVPGVICLDTTPFPKTRTEMAKMRTKSLMQSVASVFSWKKHLGSELTQEYPLDASRKSSRSVPKPDDDDVDELDELAQVEAEAEHQQNPQPKPRGKPAKAKA